MTHWLSHHWITWLWAAYFTVTLGVLREMAKSWSQAVSWPEQRAVLIAGAIIVPALAVPGVIMGIFL